MSTFMQNATEYGAFYVGETTEGMTILHPDVFHTEKEHYTLLRGERWRNRCSPYSPIIRTGLYGLHRLVGTV